jgi:predicted TIM-barrel enzyme
MTGVFSRAEILQRLRSTTAEHRPVLCATAGNGLIARSLEAGGCDLLLTSVTGLARQRGLPSISWRMNDNNQVVRDVISEIGAVTQRTPLIASVGATLEPLGADFSSVVASFTTLGYSGVLNYPTVGEWHADYFPQMQAEFIARGERPGATEFEVRMAESAREHQADLESKVAAGNGYERELELIRAAHAADVFTMGYAWTPEQAREMAQAGADIIVGHCGGTAGGSAGAPMITVEAAAKWLNGIFGAARSVRPDVMLMGHGGPFATPPDTERLYELTDAVGFLSGSAVERIPVERAVREAVMEFKSVRL